MRERQEIPTLSKIAYEGNTFVFASRRFQLVNFFLYARCAIPRSHFYFQFYFEKRKDQTFFLVVAHMNRWHTSIHHFLTSMDGCHVLVVISMQAN